MDRKDIERMTKLETKIDHMQETISQVLVVVNEMKDRQIEYVRHDDSSYFYRNMSRYNADSLQKKVSWVTLLDVAYKMIISIVSGFIIYYTMTH